MSVWCSGKEGSRKGEVTGSNSVGRVAPRHGAGGWLAGGVSPKKNLLFFYPFLDDASSLCREPFLAHGKRLP